jgi:hypothetical protein
MSYDFSAHEEKVQIEKIKLTTLTANLLDLKMLTKEIKAEAKIHSHKINTVGVLETAKVIFDKFNKSLKMSFGIDVNLDTEIRDALFTFKGISSGFMTFNKSLDTVYSMITMRVKVLADLFKYPAKTTKLMVNYAMESFMNRAKILPFNSHVKDGKIFIQATGKDSIKVSGAIFAEVFTKIWVSNRFTFFDLVVIDDIATSFDTYLEENCILPSVVSSDLEKGVYLEKIAVYNSDIAYMGGLRNDYSGLMTSEILNDDTIKFNFFYKDEERCFSVHESG